MAVQWTPTLDAILMEVYHTVGGTWSEIATNVTQRVGFRVTADMARNRYARLEQTDDLIDVLTDVDSPDQLRAALADARTQLAKAKSVRPELQEAYQDAVANAIAGMTIPPVLPPRHTPMGEERAVMLGADWQMGKLIRGNYDSDVAMQRVATWFDQSIDLISQRDVREVHLLLLGDLVENETIFPKQPHMIDSSLYRQVFNVAEVLANGIRKLLAAVPDVYVEGLGGNHGYNQKTSHPETNFDCMAMNTARLILEGEDRLVFPEPITPGEEHWYIRHEVGDHVFFGMHGNQVRSQPYSKSMRDKLNGYYATLGGFDFAVTGHYHQSLMADIGRFYHFAAGSTESGNTYAQQWLATGAQMGSQWTLFLDEDGLTSHHLIRLP